MRKSISKLLATVITLALVLGQFACVPAFANTTAPTYNRFNNITFEDKNVTNDIPNPVKTFDEKLAKLNAESYFADTTLRMTAISQNYLSSTYDNSKNLIKSAKVQYLDGTSADVTGDTYKDGYFIHGGTSGWVNSTTAIGGNEYLKDKGSYDSTHASADRKYGLSRITEGGYDLRLVLDLGETKSIDTLYMFSHIRDYMSIATYKVYVGNSEDVFSSGDKVLYWDYINAYGGNNQGAYLFNGDNVGGNSVYTRSEGQIWNFTGNDKPCGRYVGIEFVDAAATEKAFIISELGVFGGNTVEVYKDNDVPADKTLSMDTKLSKLKYSSMFAKTALRMTALDQAYMDKLLEDNTNHIKGVKYRYYNDAAGTYRTYATPEDITDGKIMHGNGTAYVNTNGVIKGLNGTTGAFYNGDNHGAARVSNDQYDAMLVLDLNSETEISDFYMFSHVQSWTAVATYKVFVSNSEDDLFDSENEVLYWNYYEGYRVSQNQYLFNSHKDDDKSTLHRAEGQHWNFGGAKKPIGRYVGVKIYEASIIADNDFLTIYDIGVLSEASTPAATYNLTFNHGEAIRVEADQTKVVEGESATFKILKSQDVEITSVAAGDEEIVYNNGVYTINNVTGDLDVKITTDADERFPDASGVYKGVDLTKNSSFYNKALWDGDTVYGETATVYESRGPITLAYPIDQIISVRSYDLQKHYVYGVDYTIDDGKLVITNDSSIPVCDASVVDIPIINNDIDYSAVGTWKNQLYKYQLSITYSHSETWGKDALYETKPEGKITKLSNLYKKLKKGEDITVVFYGDSTTLGCDASGLNEQSLVYSSGNDASTLSSKQFTTYGIFGESAVPEWACDTWAVQVVNALADEYGVNVNMINKAVGSSTSTWGSKETNMNTLLNGLEPDLMFIAYGGNDRNNSSATMNTNISKIIDYVRAETPDCDIVVGSSFKRAYPELTSKLSEHADGYYLLDEKYDNLVVTPVYYYTESLVTDVKMPIDYSSNGYNHMNDFGQRVYASVVSAILSENEYTVTFESIAGVVIGEVVVAEGDVPNYDAVKAINTKVEAVYGYTVKLNENGDVVWDTDVYGAGIVDNITVRPQYEAIEDLNTNVKVYDVDGTLLIDQDARFDSAIYLSSRQGAKYWADAEGNVLLASATGTLYACGTAMVIKAVAEELVDLPAVTLVSKVNDGNFSVFAHVNVEGATKYGVIYASSTYFNEVNKDFKIDDVTPNRVINVEVSAANVEGKVDFMGTLLKTGDKTRYARAYVVVNGNYIYTDVICNK